MLISQDDGFCVNTVPPHQPLQSATRTRVSCSGKENRSQESMRGDSAMPAGSHTQPQRPRQDLFIKPQFVESEMFIGVAELVQGPYSLSIIYPNPILIIEARTLASVCSSSFRRTCRQLPRTKVQFLRSHAPLHQASALLLNEIICRLPCTRNSTSSSTSACNSTRNCTTHRD